MDALPLRMIVRVLEAAHEKQIEAWRQSRFVAFVTARAMGAKINSPSELMQLPGDAPDDAPWSVDDWREYLSQEREDAERHEKIKRALEASRRK